MHPVIDVAIPTVTGREDSLARLIDSLERNTAPGILDLHIFTDEPSCGTAWRKCIEGTSNPYILLACDDLEVTSPTWAGVCCETVDKGFLPCPIVRRPDGSLESCGGDMSAMHCLIQEEQPDWTPCGFTVVPFLNRDQADCIGSHNGHYKTDTYISDKGRQLGWETVVRHGYEWTHHRSMVGRLTPSANDDREYAEAMARPAQRG